MRSRGLRLLLVAFAVLAGGAVLAAGFFYHYAMSAPATYSAPRQFNIRAGSTLRGVARQLEQAGVLKHPELFVVMARLLGESGNLKTGTYEITRPVSPYELLQRITRGSVTLQAITIVEGWAFRQIRQALDSSPHLRHDTRGLDEREILRRLGAPEPSPEGLFFPETYHFDVGSSDLVVLRRAYRLMKSHLERQWAQRPPDLPLKTPYEALILASIVEKETGHPSDRPLVAAVFINRLRKGMPLQADPTVIYGVGPAFDGNLRRQHLTTDTPYNTYTRPGLPPTPIAMPGLASLAATLNPPDSDVLYFVSKGDGSSHFSRTLSEHERAVTRYQRGGRR